MKRKHRLRGIIFFLAISASVFSACFCVVLMAGEYHSARYKLDTHKQELQGWEACRQTEPDYFKTNAETVSGCLKSLEKAQDNFWVKLPKTKLVGLFVLAGLGSAIGGYLTTWLVTWCCCLGIQRFIKLLSHCYRNIRSWIGSWIGRKNKAKATLDKAEAKEESELHPEKAVEAEAKEQTHEEQMERQVEILRDEVNSLRQAIEKLSNIEDLTK